MALELFDADYKIKLIFDHVAKFYGDQHTELENLAVKKEKSAAKLQTVKNYGCGRFKKFNYYFY